MGPFDLLGFVIGILTADLICGAGPLKVGISKKRSVLGVMAFVSCFGSGLLAGVWNYRAMEFKLFFGSGLFLGLLLAVPVAVAFTVAIIAMGPPPTPDSQQHRQGYDTDEGDDNARRT